MSLFSQNEQANAPLADRMRPRTLDEFYGQEHIVGPGRLLRRAIEADRLTSSIFYGPPGCGKTTLAGIIARQTNAAFIKLNAITSGVSDVREELKRRRTGAPCTASPPIFCWTNATAGARPSPIPSCPPWKAA